MKKEHILSALNELPREFDLEDFLEKLLVIEKLEAGLKDVKEGRVVSHEEVVKQVKKWRK
jgi:predicted transcriptional regulator